MTRKLRLTLASILAVAALGVVAPAASAYVYWTNSGNDTIGRANLDGTGANQSFIPGGAPSVPQGLAVDGNYIYWPNAASGYTIVRADLDGSDPGGFITGANGPYGVAVDGTYVYWANTFTGTIGRANLDGTSPNQSFITGASNPKGLAIDGNYIYWADNYNAIARANLDGTGTPETSFITGADYPRGIAVDANYIYWTNADDSNIGRADLDGSDPDQSFIPVAGDLPEELAVDGNYIYWAIYNGNTIGRANLNGTGADQSFITGADEPVGLAVDSLNPAGSLAPPSNDYGSQLISGGPSAAATFTLSSTGSVDLTIPSSGIGLTGTDAGQFQVSGGTCVAGTSSLPNGQSCTVTVTFDPSTTGSKSATLAVETNAGSKSAALTGIGSANPTIRGTGKPTKRFLKVKVGCGDASACTLRLTGNKVGAKAALKSRTVSVGAGAKKTVKLAYTRALKKALKKGGRVKVTATNTVSAGLQSIVIRVAK